MTCSVDLQEDILAVIVSRNVEVNYYLRILKYIEFPSRQKYNRGKQHCFYQEF